MLVALLVRELVWVLPAADDEIEAWRQRAQGIPDEPLRTDALTALDRDRLNLEGAAFLSILAPRREVMLVRLLVAYQILQDYLDSVSERPARDPVVNGRQLHLAMVEALTPGGSISDYYAFSEWRDDGGYVRALVETCRRSCAVLPGYGAIEALLLRAARGATVNAEVHDPDGERRERALREWAQREYPEEQRFAAFELAAAASSTLAIHAMLALASDPLLTSQDAAQLYAAYMPWICGASTLLDSYVDRLEDAEVGSHSYVGHYESTEAAGRRLELVLSRSTHEARQLRRDLRHTLILGAMTAMYLSKDSAWSPEARHVTLGILHAAGTLPELLLPILRVLRVLRGLQGL